MEGKSRGHEGSRAQRGGSKGQRWDSCGAVMGPGRGGDVDRLGLSGGAQSSPLCAVPSPDRSTAARRAADPKGKLQPLLRRRPVGDWHSPLPWCVRASVCQGLRLIRARVSGFAGLRAGRPVPGLQEGHVSRTGGRKPSPRSWSRLPGTLKDEQAGEDDGGACQVEGTESAKPGGKENHRPFWECDPLQCGRG